MVANGNIVTDTAPAEPAPFGILSPAVTVVYDDSDHWANGIDYESSVSCNSDVTLYSICATSVSATAVQSAGSPLWRHYFPFAVRVSFTCSTMGSTPEQIREKAIAALEACTQKAVENEFWTGKLAQISALSWSGSGEYPNRYLASTHATDVTPVPGTAVKTKYGQALLEKALGDCGCGTRGVIHATRDVASALAPKRSNSDKERLEAPLGNFIVAGAGYAGTGPNGSTPAGGKQWMYATGPVTVRLGEPVVYPEEGKPSQAIDISVNTVKYYAERVVSVTWDSCCHAAVLVDLSLDYA